MYSKILNIFKCLRKDKRIIPPMPKWDELVEMLYEQELDISGSTVEKIIYSKDRSKRYIVLKNADGLFTFRLEEIYRFTEKDWSYFRNFDEPPGYWSEVDNGHISIFPTIEDTLRAVTEEEEYIQFFQN